MVDILSRVLAGEQRGALMRKAMGRPGVAIVALSRLLQTDWRPFALGSVDQWTSARQELAESGLLERLKGELDSGFEGLAGQTVRGRPMVTGAMRFLHAELLWAVVRHMRPTTVVETGVCNGLSSAVILEAMERNGHGQLISVDLPEFSDGDAGGAEFWDGKAGAVVPAGRPVGWLVPEARRARWKLVLGKSQEVLPGLLADLSDVDVFIHDSEHSYENQLFEFRAGYRALRPGGLLIGTDLNWSRAFDDFWGQARRTGARRAFVDHACALVRKP